ncbi:MAG: GNAT family N-acetyltransferase [Solirubrobacteraceae bacterium]
MAWTTTQHPREFLDNAGPFLHARATRNTVMLTVTASLIAHGPSLYGAAAPLFGWWQEGDAPVSGAFMHTPHYPLYLSGLPEHALAPLADELVRRRRHVVGVDGGGGLAGLFAAAWTARRAEDEVVPAQHARLYRLAALRPPRLRPAGRPAVMSEHDRDHVISMLAAFADEVGTWAASTPRIDERLTTRGYTLWYDGCGAPVAVAGMSRVVGGARRIGPVFTRAEERRKGYGSAVTTAACRNALEAGASEVLLFTNAEDAASNRLYRRLGFEPLEERCSLRFRPSRRRG